MYMQVHVWWGSVFTVKLSAVSACSQKPADGVSWTVETSGRAVRGRYWEERDRHTTRATPSPSPHCTCTHTHTHRFTSGAHTTVQSFGTEAHIVRNPCLAMNVKERRTWRGFQSFVWWSGSRSRLWETLSSAHLRRSDPWARSQTASAWTDNHPYISL